jgi:hypothetical protein
MVKEKERELLTTHLSSLINFCPDMFNIRLSTPLDLEQFDGVDEIVRYYYYEQVSNNSGLKLAGYDSAQRMDYIVKTSRSKWVVVAHADIYYIDSLINYTNEFMSDNVGMIGKWPHGLTIINRDVYSICHMGFWPLYGVHLAPNDNLVGVEEKVGCRLVSSPDVSELLRIEMQGLGYHCESLNSVGSSVYKHVGGGAYD